MEKLMENLANLLKVKTLVTLTVTTVFAVMAAQGRVSAENVMHIVTIVIAFYFGTQTERRA